MQYVRKSKNALNIVLSSVLSYLGYLLSQTLTQDNN